MSTEIRQKSHLLVPIPAGVPAEVNYLAGIRCVAFDVYGTLLVSAAGEIATDRGISSGSGPFAIVADLLKLPRSQQDTIAQTYHQLIEQHHDRAHRRGTRHPEVDIRVIWAEVLAAVVPPITVEPQQVALTYELAANPVWPMPGAQELIHTLKTHGIRVAIVSNAQFYTPVILEELLGTSLDELEIRPCLWSYEIGEAKPSSVPFRGLARSLDSEGIAPGQTLYVGNDMLNDMVPAQDQGFRTVLFAGDARSLRQRNDMNEINGRAPDAVITAFNQVPAVIGIP